MERRLLGLFERMDQIPEYGNMGKRFEEEPANLSTVGIFELENMHQEIHSMEANFKAPIGTQAFSHAASLLPRRALHKRTSCSYSANLSTVGIFELENMHQEIHSMEANFKAPIGTQAFSHAASLLPRRALHKRTSCSYKRFIGRSNCNLRCSYSTPVRNIAIRNHPSSPYARNAYGMQKQVIDQNFCDVRCSYSSAGKITLRNHPSSPYARNAYGMQKQVIDQNFCDVRCSYSSAGKNTFRNHPSAPYDRNEYDLQQQFITENNCDVGFSYSTRVENNAMRHAPYTRNGHGMQQHYRHKILHHDKLHAQPVFKHPSKPYQSAHLSTQERCKQFKATRTSEGSRQTYKGLNSSRLSSDVPLQGVTLRNNPTAPLPYISQIKHNKQTSKYISQLTKKATSLKKETFGKIDKDNYCIPTSAEVDDSQFVYNTSSDSSHEPSILHTLFDDSSSLSSPEHQYTFRTASLKPRLENRASSKLNKFENEAAFQDTAPLSPLDENKEKFTKTVQGVSSFLTSIPTSTPLKENVLQNSELLKESQNEIQGHQMESLVPDDSENSHNLNLSQGESEIYKCLSKNYKHLSDVISNRNEENICIEDEKTEGLKMDVSFSFMEKGGYHPIALPLGCHKLEDDSSSSENEIEEGSILDKRMMKMGRDEFNLNVDTSSTFMPWIVIQLDEIPKVNYLDYVDLLNPNDPRLQKPTTEDSSDKKEGDCTREANSFDNGDVLPNVENVYFESEGRVGEETLFNTEKTSQESQETLFEDLNFSMIESNLEKSVDSLDLDFPDKLLDSISKESETQEAKEGLVHTSTNNLGLLSEEKMHVLSCETKVDNGFKSPESCHSAAESPAETKVSKTNSDSKSQSIQAPSSYVDVDLTDDNDTFSISPKTRKLPNSTIQLLKESLDFLKDQSLCRRRVRRLRRVSTSLRVADYTLPSFLEEFYVENESCNYTEQSRKSPEKDSDKQNLIIPDAKQHKRKESQNELKNVAFTPRRSKRSANRKIENTSQNSQKKGCRNIKNIAKKSSQSSLKADYGKHSPLAEKIKSTEKNDKPFIIQFSGKKYQCNQGVLTPVEKGQSQNDNQLDVNHDENVSKTENIAKMKNSVVKRSFANEDSDLFSEKPCKRVKSSSSPKVMVQNCLQEIALSAENSSKKLITKKSSKVHFIKQATTVKKELFPIKRKSQCHVKNPQTTSLKKVPNAKAKKKTNLNIKKKEQVDLKQNPTSSGNVHTKSLPKKRDACSAMNHENTSKSKKENSAPVTKGKLGSELPRKFVKPIIKVHQGLRNTSLKTFKEKQKSKQSKNTVSQKTATQKQFPCPHCEKSFIRTSQIDRHVKEDHQCSQCDEVCTSKGAKQTHFYYCHATEVHVCLTCRKRYSQPYHLRKHFETHSHKELIKCLLNEIKKVTGRKSKSSKVLSLEDVPSKQAALPYKDLDNTSTDQTIEKYDPSAKGRTKKKQKFMEMESSFFDQNPDLLELVHKIDYVEGESNIVKHYLYKDPELAEFYSQVKEEAHDSYYEEIEINEEYSIISHCENFLEDSKDHHFSFGDRKMSSDNRLSSSSEYSEQDSTSGSSYYPNNQYQDISRNPVNYREMNVETKANPAVSGWFSSAMNAIEQRNLEDDSTYSTYLGILDNNSEQNPTHNSITLQTFGETDQIAWSCATSSNQGPMTVSRSNVLTQVPMNSISSCHFVSDKKSSDFQNSCPIAGAADQVSEKASYPAGYDCTENSVISTSDEKKNVLLDAAKSLILLSNPVPSQDVKNASRNLTPVKAENSLWREWESICSEIEKDVQDEWFKYEAYK